MRRLIASKADTITTALKYHSGGDVTVLATPWFAAMRFARCLLTWLTGMVSAGWRAVVIGRMQPVGVVVGTVRVRRHDRLGTLRPCRRRMEPGSGASLGGF
jgi:hypothetical protein